MTNRGEIEGLVYDACIRLNEGDYEGWLKELCAEDFQYRVAAYSDELRKPMTWLEQDRATLLDLCRNIPEHFTYLGYFQRHVSIYRVTMDPEHQRAEVLSSVLIVHTTLEGESRLFASGRYEDVVDVSGVRPLLARRCVELSTRVLPFGTHSPL